MNKGRTPPTITANVEFSHGACTFQLFDNKLCRTVCEEIFAGEIYPLLPIDGDIRLILDVGSNIGAATVYLAAQYPAAQVVAVEPSPTCFSLLQRNTSAFSNIQLHKVGLSDRNGHAQLFQGARDEVTNSLAVNLLNKNGSHAIELRHAAEFVRSLPAKVDLLKLDTEGHELPILQAIQTELPAIAIIYVEYHSEEDRRRIDAMVHPTHLLWRSRATMPHRGELAYVQHNRVPAKLHALRITP